MFAVRWVVSVVFLFIIVGAFSFLGLKPSQWTVAIVCVAGLIIAYITAPPVEFPNDKGEGK